MRILITNDDGVFAPGIAALARGLHAAFGDQHELVVVAPLVDHSGASSAVGPVYDRESIPYEHVDIPGLAGVETYGIDGSPALSVILACIEGFGPRPDMVVSGINHGINAGRSALHSGTIGATLTGAQFGVRGLAVSIAWASEPDFWDTAVALACDLVPVVAGAEPSTVLNLNVPAVRPDELKGLRHGRLARTGLIRSARPEHTPLPSGTSGGGRSGGAIVLTMRGMSEDPDDPDRQAAVAELEPGSDAALVEDGWASVTPLVGVRENNGDVAEAVLAAALAVRGF